MTLANISQEVKLQGDCYNHLAMVNLANGDVENALTIFSSYAITDMPEIQFERV